jgi:hypothetical protein
MLILYILSSHERPCNSLLSVRSKFKKKITQAFGFIEQEHCPNNLLHIYQNFKLHSWGKGRAQHTLLMKLVNYLLFYSYCIHLIEGSHFKFHITDFCQSDFP